ncbi:MAG: hypothetical protein MUF83_11660, partial [Acidimicrobiales bacterium]|nr:hypothetical protein [Acidimicrobiales bacterium]
MSDAVDDGRWLVEPPAADEVRLFIEAGEGTEVTAEVRAALEVLMDELTGAETTGFMLMGGADCLPFSCNGNGPCRRFWIRPCAIQMRRVAA